MDYPSGPKIQSQMSLEEGSRGRFATDAWRRQSEDGGRDWRDEATIQGT